MTEIIIKASCPRHFNNQDVLVSHMPNKQFTCFAIANSCSKVVQNETHCRIFNYKKVNIVIPKGQKLGQIEALDHTCNAISSHNRSTADPTTPLSSQTAVSDQVLEDFAKQYTFNINPDLPADIRKKVLTLFYHKKEAFARSVEDLKQFNRREFEFELINPKPIATRQYKLSEDHAQIMDFHLEQWEKQGIIEESFAYQHNSPSFIVPKSSLHSAPPNDRLNPIHWRVVSDLRRVNANIRKQIIYSPSPKDILNEVTQYRVTEPGKPPGRSLWMSSIDLMQGFMQMGLKESCRDIVSITSNSGKHYRYTKMPFGLSISPFCFSQAIQEIFHDLKKQNFSKILC